MHRQTANSYRQHCTAAAADLVLALLGPPFGPACYLQDLFSRTCLNTNPFRPITPMSSVPLCAMAIATMQELQRSAVCVCGLVVNAEIISGRRHWSVWYAVCGVFIEMQGLTRRVEIIDHQSLHPICEEQTGTRSETETM